jgi:hypothetical protein
MMTNIKRYSPNTVALQNSKGVVFGLGVPIWTSRSDIRHFSFSNLGEKLYI